jgi:DNA topoisomerase-1
MPTTPATIEPSERRVVLARRLEKSLVAPKTQTRNGKLVAVRGYTDKRTRQTPLYATKTRTARGNVVYEYDEKQTAESTAQKFGRVAVLAQNLPEIIGDTDRALDKPDTPLEKVVGAVIALMDRCQFRIGTESMAEEHGTFGVTTLRTEHVTVSGDEIRFTFPGKKQVAWDRAIVDSRLARLVTTLKAESPDGRLFWYHGPTGESKPLKATQVNTVLNGYGVTAKDFRTYHGTRLAWEELRHFSRKASSPALSPKEIKSRIAQTVSAVAEKLGNTPAVAKGNYILPQLLKDFAVNGGRLSTTNPWRTAERMSKSVFVEEKRGCITLTQSDRDFAAYLKCLDQGEHLEKSLVKPKTQVRGGKTVLVRGYSDKRTRKPEEAAVPRAQAQPKDTGERIVSIPVAQIRPDPEQHRKTFNAAHLRELADSMKESGQKTPIVIRPITDGGKVKYQIIAGERRWRAAHLVGLKSLKATVREGVTQEQALTEQVIENLNREQVTPMEEAVAYGQLAKLFIAKAKRSKEWQGKDPAKLAEASRRYVAQQTGKQQHHVAFYLKLNDLEDEVQEMVSHGSLTPRHGNMLTRLTDGVDDPKELRERKAHQVRMARYARAHSIAADALGAMITAYLGERQQTSMFGGDEAVSGDKLEARREAKAKIDKIVSAVADAIAETFSEGKQEFRVGALGGGELVANLAKIRGAIKTLDQVAAIMEEEVARRDVGEATKRRVDSGGSGPGTHGTSLSAQASMFKSIVHAYTRRLKSGKTVQVREHQDRRGKKQITAKAKPQPHADEPMATRDAVDPMQPWKGGVPSAAASPGRLMWTAREGGTSGKPAGPVSITKPWMVLPEAIPTDEEMSDVEWQGRQGTANADMPSPHSSYLDLPVGSWRIDPVLGHMEELRSVRVDRLEPGEEVGSRFAWGDKYKYLAPYAEWLRQGHKPYPAVAVETPTGKIRLINGHRRWLAAIQAGYTHMEVWVSPAETPGASVGLSHRVMVEQALAAGKPVPPDVVARYSSMEKALFTRKHLEDLEKQGHPHGLFLLRHCEAGPHAGIDDDPTRPLTEKGERQAQRAAQWFKRQPGIRAVFASPLTRTQETAKPVAAALGLKVQTEAALAPGKLTVGTIRRLVASVKGQGSIVVVSHEPDLSSLLKQLTGDENKFSRGEVRQVEWNDLRAGRGSVVGAVKNREMKDPETVPMKKALLVTRGKFNLRELIAALRTRLAREEETIGAYEADAARSPKPQVAAQLQSIADEERVHVGELTRLLMGLTKKEKRLLEEGKAEEEGDVQKRRVVLARMEKSYVKPHTSHTADGKPYHVAGHVDKRTKKAKMTHDAEGHRYIWHLPEEDAKSSSIQSGYYSEKCPACQNGQRHTKGLHEFLLAHSLPGASFGALKDMASSWGYLAAEAKAQMEYDANPTPVNAAVIERQQKTNRGAATVKLRGYHSGDILSDDDVDLVVQAGVASEGEFEPHSSGWGWQYTGDPKSIAR